ncbi:hypothetical protein DSM3645_15200 [Blastopirellula marina DSM 3645]|uniref:Uncharacterized protein n=1 Tax=Blastopirellula marina DSM 3645 TaxID=314230 RepID=A4A259_9BACT|nr:hypothetical protein DSM3645_15200 [Blastopirellula marina DSM 3645]
MNTYLLIMAQQTSLCCFRLVPNFTGITLILRNVAMRRSLSGGRVMLAVTSLVSTQTFGESVVIKLVILLGQIRFYLWVIRDFCFL